MIEYRNPEKSLLEMKDDYKWNKVGRFNQKVPNKFRELLEDNELIRIRYQNSRRTGCDNWNTSIPISERSYSSSIIQIYLLNRKKGGKVIELTNIRGPIEAGNSNKINEFIEHNVIPNLENYLGKAFFY